MNTEDMREQAKDIIENGKAKAGEFLEDGGKMDQLLDLVEDKLETVPKAEIGRAHV